MSRRTFTTTKWLALAGSLAAAVLALTAWTLPGPCARAQEPRPKADARPADDIRELKLKDWQPKAVLKVKATEVEKPAFPVVDVHNHLGSGATLTPERVRRYLAEMDAAGVRAVVNLDGGWDDRLKQTLAALDEAHPGRFLTYALVNFDGIDDPGWSDREAKRLEEGFKAGAKGLKFHKTFGLGHRYKDGRFVPVDDPKLDPIWEVCARYRRPVEIHTGDPGAFFTPLDRFNERWHELNAHPNWLFADPKFPRREELHAQRNRVIARHPRTTFICAHMANDGEDLDTLAKWLDAYPNMLVDIDARIQELGRVPYSARRFFLKYQDRIMFGTDTPPNRVSYRMYYRFLETDDEYFDPAAGHHTQGFWMIYGVFLPRDVLEKLYFRNAEKFLVGLNDPGRASR
jgi:predicted TIM-barrel fold metal-dependent hydrolase